MFGDPFDNQLVKHISPLVHSSLSTAADDGSAVKVHEGKTVVVMEGPQFSTRAESTMYRQWGTASHSLYGVVEVAAADQVDLFFFLFFFLLPCMKIWQVETSSTCTLPRLSPSSDCVKSLFPFMTDHLSPFDLP
jgi:hypothetical protein